MRSLQADLNETHGFAFVEFVSQDSVQLGEKLICMGFVKQGVTAQGDKILYRQGDINFVINNAKDQNAGRYREQHKHGASALAFFVKDSKQTYFNSLKKGSEPASDTDYPFPALKGVGGGVIYLVEKENFSNILNSIFIPVASDAPLFDIGLKKIDHLTHNVSRGSLSRWEKFYSNVFSFRRIKTFDIQGAKTGLRSVALESPNGQIKIPINESSDDSSQIEEFLRLNEGEGVQHIALTTDDIYQTIENLRAAGIEFQESPDTYYELLDNRHPHHGENTEALHRLGILLDSDHDNDRGKLLQIFTKETIGPMFFEIIQRKGNQGFGEGNFQALFESMELDQMRRGVI